MRKVEKRLNQIDRTLLFISLVLTAGVFILGLAWAQETSSQGVFRGIITKIDSQKGIVVRNQDQEMIFQWGPETMVNGFRLGEEGSISKDLKEGMGVTILYREVERNRVASEITVKETSVGPTKGWELPFGCGISVC